MSCCSLNKWIILPTSKMFQRMSDEDFHASFKKLVLPGLRDKEGEKKFIETIQQETKQPFLVRQYLDLKEYNFNFTFLSGSCVTWKGNNTALNPAHRQLTLLIVGRFTTDWEPAALTTFTNAGGRRVLFMRIDNLSDRIGRFQSEEALTRIQLGFGVEEILDEHWTVVRESNGTGFLFERYDEQCRNETRGYKEEILQHTPLPAPLATLIVEFC